MEPETMDSVLFEPEIITKAVLLFKQTIIFMAINKQNKNHLNLSFDINALSKSVNEDSADTSIKELIRDISIVNNKLLRITKINNKEIV